MMPLAYPPGKGPAAPRPVKVYESPFARAVREELERARAIYKDRHASYHEAYAVLLEEVDELWAEIKKKPSARSPLRMMEELIQIGAMAQRAAEDCKLIDTGEGD